MKKFLCETWYGPVAAWCVFAGLLLAHGAVDAFLQYRMPRALDTCLGWAFGIPFVAATLFNIAVFLFALTDKQWKRALLQLLAGVVALGGFVFALASLLFFSMLGPSDDHFADDLTIPPELEADLVVPQDRVGDSFSTVDVYDDDFAIAIFKGLKDKGGDDPTVTCDLSALADLVHNRRDELMAYLARHPGWWLHEEYGQLCAMRRVRVRGVWNHSLHGYCSGNTRKSDHAEDYDAYHKATYYQTRTSIDFFCSSFGRKRGAEHPAVATVKADIDKDVTDAFESSMLFGDKDFCVDVFEQSAAKERRITNAALAFLKDEFAALKLPEDAAVRGPEQFVLRNDTQPGIYNLTLRINPGEPGVTYLKAYEVTKGTRLSEDRLYDRSNERVGWSDDPSEKFLYENEFTIYEGDWGKPYAARIEVWFRPDSGKGERKLMERVCKIEGWQR